MNPFQQGLGGYQPMTLESVSFATLDFLVQLGKTKDSAHAWTGGDVANFSGRSSTTDDNSKFFHGSLHCYCQTSGMISIETPDGNVTTLCTADMGGGTSYAYTFTGAFKRIIVASEDDEANQYTFSGFTLSGYNFVETSPFDPAGIAFALDNTQDFSDFSIVSDLPEIAPGAYLYGPGTIYFQWADPLRIGDGDGNTKYYFPPIAGVSPVYSGGGPSNFRATYTFAAPASWTGNIAVDIRRYIRTAVNFGQAPISANTVVPLERLIDQYTIASDALVSRKTADPNGNGYFVAVPVNVGGVVTLAVNQLVPRMAATTQIGDFNTANDFTTPAKSSANNWQLRAVGNVTVDDNGGTFENYLHTVVQSPVANINTLQLFSDFAANVRFTDPGYIGTRTGNWQVEISQENAFWKNGAGGTISLELPSNSASFATDYLVQKISGAQTFTFTPTGGGGVTPWTVAVALSGNTNAGYNFYQITKNF